MRKILCSAVLAALFVQFPFAHAATSATSATGVLPDPAARIPVGPQVKVGTLPNGLTYYIQRNGKPAKRLELRLVVKAGSVLEDDDQQGLAHFLEHMAFQGSTHFDKHELVSYLQSIGVSFGADLNAYTSFDETVYYLPVPTDKPDYVEQGFTVLQDWAGGLRLDADAVDKERAVVLEELRLGKGAGERVQKVMLPKLFNGSRYAERLPIGKEDILHNAKADALRRFYHDWYRPDLMAVIVVGDIDPAEGERLVKAHFSNLKNPDHERERRYPDVPVRTTTEALVVTDKEITTNSVALQYPVRLAPNRGTYGDYRDLMVARLFGMMLNQRLGELAQQPAPPFMGAAAGVSHMFPRYENYAAGASLGAGGAGPALTALVQEQQRLRRYGFTAPELERARKTVLHGLERAYNERDTTNSIAFVDEYQRNFLAGEAIGGIDAEYRLAQALLPAIGLDEVNAFARKTVPADAGKLVMYIGGDGAAKPAGEQLLATASAAERAPVNAREEKALASALMARPATPGKVVATTVDKALGLTTLMLSNGVKVILKPTDFTKDQVILAGQRFGGQDLFDAGDLPNVRYAPAVAAVMGLKDFSPTDLDKMLAGRTAGAGVSMGNSTDNVSAHAGSGDADLETMFQLLWLRFGGTRRDENLYRSYMGKQTEILRNRLATPEARFNDALVDTLYDKHPYEPRAMRLEDAEKVDLDRSLAIYRQRFSSARDMTFVLVGDFDVARITPLVTAYLGTLPTPDLQVAYRDPGLRFAKGVIRKDVLAGTEPKATVSLTFSGPATWSQAESLRMSALIQVMNLRIVEVLREKLSLIYSGGMGGALVKIPYQHYMISATLPTGPDNVDKVVAAMFAEIERMKTQGPDQADLDKYKRNTRLNLQRYQRENGYWLNGIQGALFDGTDPHRLLTIGDEVEALTPADLQATARRYFDTDNYVQMVLKPEAAARVAGAAR